MATKQSNSQLLAAGVPIIRDGPSRAALLQELRKGLFQELEGIYKREPLLADEYRKRSFWLLANPQEMVPHIATEDMFKTPRLRREIAKQALAEGRRAVYQSMGIGLMPLAPQIKKRQDRCELVGSDHLFRMAAYGGLRKEILEIARISRPDSIEIEALYASAHMFHALVRAHKALRSVFIDQSGVQADMLAAKLLEGTPVATPRMKNKFYAVPEGMEEFGVLAHIADTDGVKNAVSIRALARSERMTGLVFRRFEEFSRMLGYAFEACRILGIQDMHGRNAFALEYESGSPGVGRIDLDIVAIYATTQRYKEAFVGQLFRILDSLYFAVAFGASVRCSPETIMEEIRKVPPKEARAALKELAIKMFRGFLVGAEDAYVHFSRKEEIERVNEVLSSHNGIPVGWGVDERNIKRAIREQSRLLKESIKTIKRAYVNGAIPQYISSGAHAGRMILDSKKAWEHGFSQQVKWMRNTFRDFWKDAFDMLKLAIPVWKPDGEQVIPVVTIAN